MPQGDGRGPAERGRGGRGRSCGMGRGRGKGQGQGQRLRHGKPRRVSCQPPTQSNALVAAPPGSSESVEHAKKQAGAVVRTHDPQKRCRIESRASSATPVACVTEEECTLCGACQAVCPTEAISLGETAVKVNAGACCGCGACVEVCPSGAIRLT